jgi:hypothetical protein
MDRSPETFVPENILNLLNDLKEKYNWSDVNKYNSWLKLNKPDVPRSTRTRWTRSFIKNQAHSVTPSWHTHYRYEKSIIPEKFSTIKDGRIGAARASWRDSGYIRYVNISDFHRPYNDGALLTLAMRVVKAFEPNIFPCFSDWLDMDRFKQHPPKPGNYDIEYHDETKRQDKFTELEELSIETINLVKSHLSKDCTLLNVWGNHEQWLLRSLIGETIDGEFGEYFVNKYFKMLDDSGVLWIDGEKNHWFPVTKHFWIGHGHRSRSGYGKTAQGYLNLVKNQASVAVGHTHRQEVVRVAVPFDGERFACVAGTLGQVQPIYANREFMGHNWGFQLIEHPIEGSKGNHVEDVRVYYKDGYYVTNVFGKEYSEQATIEYDEYMDFI